MPGRLLGKAAVEWAQFGIRVNGVAPGLTETPLARAWFQGQPDPESFKAGVASRLHRPIRW